MLRDIEANKRRTARSVSCISAFSSIDLKSSNPKNTSGHPSAQLHSASDCSTHQAPSPFGEYKAARCGGGRGRLLTFSISKHKPRMLLIFLLDPGRSRLSNYQIKVRVALAPSTIKHRPCSLSDIHYAKRLQSHGLSNTSDESRFHDVW